MLKNILCVVFLFLFGTSVFARVEEPPKEKIIHIYYMHELQPTLLMAADALRRPKDELKIIFNFYEMPDAKAFNILSLKMRLESGIEIQNGTLYKIDDFNKFKKIYKKHTDAKFIIHTGFFLSINRIMPFLRYIPRNKIKEIHIYESSVGRIKNRWKLSDFVFDKSQMKICIKRQCIRHSDLLFSLGFLYPTVYHIGFLDEFKKNPQNKSFWKNISITNSKFLDMDFNKLSKELPQAERDALLRWYEFDYKAYKKEIAEKKVQMFIVGHASEKRAEQKVISAILDWYNRYKDDKNTILFIKWGRNKKLIEKFNHKYKLPIKTFPDVTFELLILANLIPDKVSGTPSSLYLHLPKENIGQMYNIWRSTHINILLEQKKIEKEQIINL